MSDALGFTEGVNNLKQSTSTRPLTPELVDRARRIPPNSRRTKPAWWYRRRAYRTSRHPLDAEGAGDRGLSGKCGPGLLDFFEIGFSASTSSMKIARHFRRSKSGL